MQEPHWRRAARSTVRIEHDHGTGTGFLIDPSGIFVTAYHVVAAEDQPAAQVWLLRCPIFRVPGAVIAVDERRDLALIEATLPSGHGLRIAALAPLPAASASGRLIAFHMLDPSQGFSAAVETATDHVGETAVAYQIGGATRLIDRVWSRQDLVIAGGTSGAPAVDLGLAAITAVACAGADHVRQAFFVPLYTIPERLESGAKSQIQSLIASGAARTTRLGKNPNERGVRVLGWLATRKTARSLIDTAVYDPLRALTRLRLVSAIEAFASSDKPMAIVAGVSGVGKSTGVVHVARHTRFNRPVVVLRAAQLDLDLASGFGAAIARALNVEDLEDLPSDPAAGPLLVIDGFNELRTPEPRRVWMDRGEFARFVRAIASKGWKVLVTTRVETLNDFDELPHSIPLFDLDELRANVDAEDTAEHMSAGSLFSGTPPAAEHQNELFKLPPHIRLDGFDRSEFEEVRRSYQLPPNLPYDVFRHPIVLRLAIRARNRDRLAKTRVRELLGEYFATVVSRIHARLPIGRSREMIAKRLEELTALEIKSTLGFIPNGALPQVDDQGLTEAATTEGLLEHVPGGYRYVYDEVYEFVRARTLAGELIPGTLRDVEDVFLLLGKPRGLSPALVARALEIAGDRDPQALSTLAERLVAGLQTEPSSRAAVQWTAILGRIELGGPLDRAKDALPIFVPSDVMRFDLAVLSEDHLSYAFSHHQLWQIVRAASRLESSVDSYPFRDKDLLDESAQRSAKYRLLEEHRFSAVRHLIDVSPKSTADRLIEGLGDHEPWGREHSFGDFCAHVLATFTDRFDFDLLVRVSGGEARSFALFQRLARQKPDLILERFSDPALGLVARPGNTSRCLWILSLISPATHARAATIATDLVLRMHHPVEAYGWAIPPDIADRDRTAILQGVNAAWANGTMDTGRLLAFHSKEFFSFDEMLAMLRQRLSSGKRSYYETPDMMVATLVEVIELIADPRERASRIEAVVDRIMEFPGTLHERQAAAAEYLLPSCTPLQAVPPRFKAFLSALVEKAPATALSHLKYFIFNSRGGDAADWLKDEIGNLVSLNVPDIESAWDALEHGCDRAPESGRLRRVAANLIRKVGAAPLFSRVRSVVDDWIASGFDLPDSVRVMINLHVDLGYPEFAELLRHPAGESPSDEPSV